MHRAKRNKYKNTKMNVSYLFYSYKLLENANQLTVMKADH